MPASRVSVCFIRSRQRDVERLHAEPVSFGVPFARGDLADTDHIEVLDDTGCALPRQAETLERWPDGSVRWALIDLILPAGRAETAVSIEVRDRPLASSAATGGGVSVRERGGAYLVETGPARFEIGRAAPWPFTATLPGAAAAPTFRFRVVMEDNAAEQLAPRLGEVAVEAAGPVRATLAARGALLDHRGREFCRFASRASFFAATALVRFDLTVHNARRARHRGGIWDLGDPGSILFRALRLDVLPAAAPTEQEHRIRWRLSPGGAEHGSDGARLEIHQASSGGENWASPNHVDRRGTVALAFRGCRVTRNGQSEGLDRPQPVVAWARGGATATVALPRFWQEFPKCIEAGADGLRVSLFPSRGGTSFELQGGERKTHTVWLGLATERDGAEPTAELAWVHDPLVARMAPEHFASSAAFAHFVPEDRDPHASYVELARRAIAGPDSFFAKREVIDEYGWRHFGDTWADHEDEHYAGEHPVISHHNNQYDLVHGFLLHFARSGDPRWFELAADLARHVADIDIYHTTEDKPAYSGGLFWHTDHYNGAGRATHRSYTADSPSAAAGRRYGGGPSNENNYTTGLLHFHYLTGDPGARAAVLELAEWVLRMDDGAESLLGRIAPGPTGLASGTRDLDYHGPGRGAGNSVNAMLDAHRLTGEPRYLAKAEELIARVIHPSDDPDRNELRDAERRWSYTVFLQALGKYLDRKSELGERDRAYAFARASLLRYASWMAEHERPFAARLDRVEYPTESWPAQDVRKSCVFDYAARYGPPESRALMTERAEYFFRESLSGVLSFPAPARTRPLAVLLANGVQRAASRASSSAPSEDGVPRADFDEPRSFVPQRRRALSRLRTAAGLLALARGVLSPALVRRALAGRIW